MIIIIIIIIITIVIFIITITTVIIVIIIIIIIIIIDIMIKLTLIQIILIYREGYLFKEVSVETYIDTENIRPRLEELSLFKPSKREDDRYDDQDDRDGEGDGDDEHQSLESRSLMRDIVDQLKDLGE